MRLTQSQLPIWVAQRLSPDSPLYNMAFAFRFPEGLRPDVFQTAWIRTVEANEILRTSVQDREGIGVPVVRSSAGPGIRRLDLSGEPDSVSAFHRWCQEQASHPLALEGDLVDSTLVDLGGHGTGWYLNQHHLICDAWSTVLLYRAVAAHYQALIDGSSRPDSAPGYYAIAEGLPTIGRPDARRRAEAHWEDRQARGAGSASLYGGDGVPVGTPSTRLTLELDDARSRSLDELAAADGLATLVPEMSRFAVLSAILLAWLHRVSGETELGFDAPVAGRPTPESKRALGPFIEMFPFSVSVDPTDTLRTLATRCLAEAGDYLGNALPGMGSARGSLVSNVVLNYFPQAFGPFAGAPAEVRWVHPGHGDQVHALRLQVHDFSGTGRYVLHFDVNEGALPERHRNRIPEHFDRLMTALLGDPDRSISSVDIRTDRERSDEAALNDTGSAPLPEATVVEMFDRQADRTPERIALREGEDAVSFADLKRRADAVASALCREGVQIGDRVPVLAKRSISAVAGVLGVLKAGAAYVPIDPSHPDRRVVELIRDANAGVVLMGPSVAPLQPGPDVRVLEIEECASAGTRPEAALPQVGLSELAYVLYTSGSTGRPKGVLVEHAGVADYLRWADRLYVRGDRLTFPLFTSLGFDLTVTSLFLPLITGGTLEIYPEPEGPVDTALVDVLSDNRVDFIKLTPSHLSLLLRTDLEGSRIRRMVVGGEDFRSRLAARATARLGAELEIYNEYGPTEAIVGCTVHRYDPDRSAEAGGSVPIGRPADHVEIRILDSAGTPVPEGVPGELWVTRYGLARGYHGLEERTDERFVEDPSRLGVRWYRTGDLVRQGTTRELEFLGRIDRQLKVSGFRIEPGEIEAVLASHPGIEECVVLARPANNRAAESPESVRYCVRCGLPSNFPGVTFDDRDICDVCVAYETIGPAVQDYFESMEDLQATLADLSGKKSGAYDCMMLLSGGKDSTYALCQLVEMGFSVYAYTLDNGFISEGAKENMRRVTEALGVPLEVGTTPSMNAIFRDSLDRFSNVCQGCFKTIYTLSTKRAHELGIPVIVTGLSRGQMFETRLTPGMFRDGTCTPAEVDGAVAAARKAYHRMDDEVARSLDVELFRSDDVFDQIQFVDFYRYCDVDMADVFSYLAEAVPWVRPADTGRSTNCLINDVGIYVHNREQGFHNYALPYSWDVRLGHKTRDEALHELHDDLDMDHVRRTLRAIDFEVGELEDVPARTTVAAFYVSREEVDEADLQKRLREHLPSQLVPQTIERIDRIPLTANGKIDEAALPWDSARRAGSTRYVAPDGPVEEYLAATWRRELGISRVGATDDFFALGGTSLVAMEIMVQLCREFDIDLPLESLFETSTLRGLARVAEQRILAAAAELV